MMKIFTLLFLLTCGYSVPAQQVLTDKELFLKKNPQNQTYLLADGRYMALDVYRFGRIKRHRFFVGDELSFKLKNGRKRQRESITAISDSSFTISNFNNILNENLYTEIKFREVRKIRVYRRIPWVTQGAYMLPVAGGLFFLSDTFKYHGGMEFRVQFDPKSTLIAGGIASLGLLCKQLSFPSYNLRRQRLHVLRVK
ncbi:hypothetical protein [Runella sp.]|jgi:hypothetical protein|uniref:hypothetical protein n=1 Tax=Runella sp. TaxID=1960881 RepID=UPI00263234CA|nr:hypothetical protein [Runella sp.]